MLIVKKDARQILRGCSYLCNPRPAGFCRFKAHCLSASHVWTSCSIIAVGSKVLTRSLARPIRFTPVVAGDGRCSIGSWHEWGASGVVNVSRLGAGISKANSLPDVGVG